MTYTREQYETERQSEHRTFARDHSYGEWVEFRKQEAGETAKVLNTRWLLQRWC